MGQRVLVVDQNYVFGSSISKSLSTCGMNAVHALTIQDAIRYSDRNVYDIAIIELNIPIMCGMDLARVMFRKNPSIVTIIMSDSVSIEDYIRAQSLGIADILTKPFEIDMLINMIDYLTIHNPADISGSA